MSLIKYSNEVCQGRQHLPKHNLQVYKWLIFQYVVCIIDPNSRFLTHIFPPKITLATLTLTRKMLHSKIYNFQGITLQKIYLNKFSKKINQITVLDKIYSIFFPNSQELLLSVIFVQDELLQNSQSYKTGKPSPNVILLSIKQGRNGLRSRNLHATEMRAHANHDTIDPSITFYSRTLHETFMKVARLDS